jgi:hypothetical protein
MDPTFPSLSIPTCGANITTMFPSGVGTWLLKAPQPVLPVNGRPAKPARGKTSPHLLANWEVISSSGSSWLISSGHELSANNVLSAVNPNLDSWVKIFSSAYFPLTAPLKYIYKVS